MKILTPKQINEAVSCQTGKRIRNLAELIPPVLEAQAKLTFVEMVKYLVGNHFLAHQTKLPSENYPVHQLIGMALAVKEELEKE